MQDWILAIIIIAISIIISLALTKRKGWRSKRKPETVESNEKPDALTTVLVGGILFVIGAGLIYGIVKLFIWIFDQMPNFIINTTNAALNITEQNSTGTIQTMSGTFGVSTNFITISLIIFVIFTIMMAMGSRWMRRNLVIFLIMMLPVLIFLGVPTITIFIGFVIIIPIIVWRSTRSLRY